MKRPCLLPTVLLIALVVALTVPAFAEAWKGSIKVKGKPTAEALAKMAKVTRADAEKTALAAVESGDAVKTTREVELEVENKFLIWSIEIETAGKPGIDEILIDAGTGKVLAREHEDEDDGEDEKDGKDEDDEDDATKK